MYNIFGFYKFKKITNLKKKKELLNNYLKQENFRGTIILSPEGANGTISFKIDRYISRIEFFMLQVRELGSDTWYDLKNGLSNHTGLFAVRGNTPEFQYNAISIVHPTEEQYAYRFKPYPGNFITRKEPVSYTHLTLPTKR